MLAVAPSAPLPGALSPLAGLLLAGRTSDPAAADLLHEWAALTAEREAQALACARAEQLAEIATAEVETARQALDAATQRAKERAAEAAAARRELVRYGPALVAVLNEIAALAPAVCGAAYAPSMTREERPRRCR